MMRVMIAASALLVALPASAVQMEKMGLASGLADVIGNAEHCQYTIDEAALEAYFTENKLDDPETLSFINSRVSLHNVASKPKPSVCTLSRATGKKIGIVK